MSIEIIQITTNPTSIPIPNGDYVFNEYYYSHMEEYNKSSCYNCGSTRHWLDSCPYECRYCHKKHEYITHGNCYQFFKFRIDYLEYRYRQGLCWQSLVERRRLMQDIIGKLDDMYENMYYITMPANKSGDLYRKVNKIYYASKRQIRHLDRTNN